MSKIHTQSIFQDIKIASNKKTEINPQCKECGSISIYNDASRGEDICTNCGLVLSERQINMGDYTRPCSEYQDKIKLMHYGGPIGKTKIKDAFSKTMIRKTDYAYNNDFKRIMRWDSMLDNKTRTSIISYVHIIRVSEELNLPNHVRTEATSIFTKAMNMNLLRGYTIEGISIAAIYYSCKLNRIPRTMGEISETAHLSMRYVAKLFSILSRNLQIPIPALDLKIFLDKYSKLLHVPVENQLKCMNILRTIKSSTMSGKNPLAFIGALIYIVGLQTGNRINQKTIAQKMRLTEVTLRKRIVEIAPKVRHGVLGK